MTEFPRLFWKTWPENRQDLFYLVILGLLVISAGLGLRDPWPADEPRFALIARDMVDSGQWLFPRVGGVLYPDKPPVFFWIMAGFYAVTGSVRAAFLLPSLFAGLFTLVLIYDLGRRIWTREAGWLAALLLLATLQFAMQVKMARIDALLTFFVTLGFYGFSRHLLIGPAWRWYCIGFFAVGLGIITKGVGFLPLLLFIPWWYARQQRWTGLAKIDGTLVLWMLGPVLMLVAISLWLVPMLLAVASSGDPALLAYRDDILFRQTASRFVEGWHHSNPFWYYLTDVIPKTWFPLNLALFWLIPEWVKQLRARNAQILLPLSWAILVVLFFSLSEGKRGVYILPVLPILALVAGSFLHNILERKSAQFIIRLLLLTTVLWALYQVVAESMTLPGNITAALDGQVEIDFSRIKIAFAIWCGLMLVFSFNRNPAGALLGSIIGAWLLVGWWGVQLVNQTRIPRAVMAMADFHAGERSLGIVHWKAQHLLFAARDMTHFGFRREDFREEMRDGLAWLLGEPDRVLMLPNDVSMRCLLDTELLDLGSSNRHKWFLVEPGAVRNKCKRNFRRQAATIVYHYQLPAKDAK